LIERRLGLAQIHWAVTTTYLLCTGVVCWQAYEAARL